MKKLIASVLIVAALISSLTLSADALESQTTPDTLYLPEEVLADHLFNTSQALESFLTNCSNKKVIFPSGKTFILDRQLVLHDVSNLDIDFNGCTIQLPNDLDWKTRYDTGEYVPLSAIAVHNSKNISFRNYIIDGNSANIAPDQWCIGLWLSNTQGFYSENGTFENCNYHQVVIYSGTKNINFTGTLFMNHGGASLPAGISDVYVSNNPDDNFSFIDTTVDNTALRERQGQCFYISGYNGIIDTVNTNNCSVPLDVRKGTHIARNFTIKNADLMLMVQPNPNNSTEFANLTASNFTGIDIKGKSNGGAAGVYIVGCQKCHLDNFNIGMDAKSQYSWFGIRIRKFYSKYPLKDVVITNTKVSNTKSAGFMIQNLDAQITLKDIKLENTTSAIKTDSCPIQPIKNVTLVDGKAYTLENKTIIDKIN